MPRHDGRATAAPSRPRSWCLPAPDASEEERASALSREVGVSRILGQLLVRRGVLATDEARAFLDPALQNLHEPWLLPDMDRAADRIVAAIGRREKVLVYADYDVDGTTGAAILLDVLSYLGGDVAVHVPDRVRDGYGMKKERLARARAEGVSVVVSVDSGVAAIEEAAFCRELGIDLIVTDHHQMKEELPDAFAVVHPRLPGSIYPNPDICGAGVAFKLAWTVAARRNGGGTLQQAARRDAGVKDGVPRPGAGARERLLRALGLVALGTVADVVPLRSPENRAFVRHGLRALEHAPTPGVRALLDVARVSWPLDAEQIAFKLAPRLNAAGRMGDASRALRLLAAKDDATAGALALELDRDNDRRRVVQKDVVAAALAQAREVYGDPSGTAGLVLGDAGWPLGVVGIVAAKVVEETGRPALVLSFDHEPGKGSGRTAGGVDLVRALGRCASHLIAFGGHAQAVGLTLRRDALGPLRDAFARAVSAENEPASTTEKRGRAPAPGALEIDALVELGDVRDELLREIGRLEPFGAGNTAPLFAAHGVEVAGEPRPLGRTGDHLALYVRQRERVLRAVAFGRRDLLDELREKGALAGPSRRPIDIAFRPRWNRWNGACDVELELADVRTG